MVLAMALTAITSIAGSAIQSIEQPPSQRVQITPSIVHIRVWVLIPSARTLPTADQLKSEGLRWMTVKGFAHPEIRYTTDRDLLQTLEKLNPNLRFLKIERKLEADIPSDQAWSPELGKDFQFKFEVKSRTREDALKDIARTHGKELAAEFRKLTANQLIAYKDVAIPAIDSEHDGKKPDRFWGYTGVVTGEIHAVNPDVSFRTQLAPDGTYKVSQVPTYLVLFQLTTINGKGGLSRRAGSYGSCQLLWHPSRCSFYSRSQVRI
jgi:hypothetical protein